MVDKPQGTKATVEQQAGEAKMAPGDEAPPGTPGTGEDVCPACSGSGRADDGECATCLGRGRVVKAISAGP
jgi:DnaJ-class molecular chaperone